MSEEEQSSKTEEPTERKLRKARDKGDVPASRETGNLMSVFALLVITVFLLPQVLPNLAGVLRGLLELAGQIEIGEGAAGLADIGAVSGQLSRGIAVAVGPVVAVMVLAALFGVLIQGETVVALERIKPKTSKISPIAGIKRLFSADTLVEFLKNVAKVLVVGTLAVFIAHGAVTAIWQSPNAIPESFLTYVRQAVLRLLIAATLFLVVIAVIDILWKRAQWIKKQRMSMRELRDEHKDSEGDPHIKAKRSEIRRKRARQRIATAVPTATLVLTNPTHYAVALKYVPGVDQAPVCVAKGTGLMAAQIRRIARENDVAIVENRPLARTLHALVEIDSAIPIEHWQAVAEIIGYIMDLRRNIRRKPPVGSQLRDVD
ncbi:flagellar biosynthesis protein FlhB [Roseinatronobacter sp.]|uniref:flagellar biosynthesis protein FlhB n=1 Tax=Roseinatronobacter sp. TaxID=1945755 RepID=UPI003F6EED4B